jgi:hypothetical protein
VISRRSLGVASIAVGLALAGLSRLAMPSAPPLYDGVIVNEPYRWLEPPPGALGGAQGFSATDALEAGSSPLIAAQTPETPPQASVFAPPGALKLPPGTTSIKTTITPIPAEGTPSNGHVAGNVYRIQVTNQNGLATTGPADAFVSVVMRGPEGTTDATIERFENGAWKPLTTDHAGYTSGFLSIVTEFGDFTLVAPGPSGTPSGSASGSASASAVAPSPETTTTSATPAPGSSGGLPVIVIAVVGGGIVVLGATVIYALRSRPRQPPPRRSRDRRRR